MINILVGIHFINDISYYSYNGRATAASPATGSKAAHNKELRNLLDEFCVL